MNKQTKAVFLDISGVLYDGEHIIPGAHEAIKVLRKMQLPLRFVTNTASQSSDQILLKLRTLGFELSHSELITAPSAAKQYIIKKGLRPFCLIHPNLKCEFKDIDQSQANAVLLGDAREDLSYENLNHAFRLCQSGCPLIGIGMNKYFSDGEQLCLDAGLFIKGIEWAANTPAVIMGKPSKAFFEQVLASCDVAADQCLMVGDDVTSDVQGAIDTGLQACLVRTGKYTAEDEQQLSAQAMVIDSIAALTDRLKQQYVGLT